MPSTANVEAYAHIVQERFFVRSLILAAKEIETRAQENGENAGELLDWAEQRIYEIRQGREVRGLRKIGDIMVETYDHLQKTRLSGTEVRIAPATMDVEGKSVLIVDDMISTGGTIIAAAAALREAGARSVSVACTHGVFVNNAICNLTGSSLDTVLCCNTLENELSHISVAPIIANALRKV